jgi:spore maturation protein CgeB
VVVKVKMEASPNDFETARMKILFVGADTGTGRHRKEAFERLGHQVQVVNPLSMYGLNGFIQVLAWRLGCFGLAAVTYNYVISQVGGHQFDFCFVNHGETISARLVRFLKSQCRYVAAFNADNPFVRRDGMRWRLALEALPEYDSFATPRRTSVHRALACGAQHVIRYVQAADEVLHRPRAFSEADVRIYSSEVAFVGTWMPERGVLAARLVEAGVPFRIFGANWHKAPEYRRLADRIVVSTFLDDERYVRAIQYTRIAIGLVSLQNEDEHTNRSAEIPAIGTLLCAKRTPQHLEMYKEGDEAIFWHDADECAAQCLSLLADPKRLARIAAAGQARMNATGNWNEPLMDRIITETIATADSRRRGA